MYGTITNLTRQAVDELQKRLLESGADEAARRVSEEWARVEDALREKDRYDRALAGKRLVMVPEGYEIGEYVVRKETERW